MNELIKQARELCEKAMPGPWKIGRESPSGAQNVGTINGVLTAQTTSKDNAAFIATSRTIVPQLCDALEAAQKEIEKLNGSVTSLSGMIDQYAEQARDAIDQQECDRKFYEKSVSEYNAHAEKAEAERDTYKAALQNWHEQEGE